MFGTIPLLLAAAVAAASQSPGEILQKAFSCMSDKVTVKATELALVDAKGGQLIAVKPGSDGEYHLPEPLDLLGVRTNRVGIQTDEADSGRSATTYSALLPQAVAQDIAHIAKVDRNDVGEFRQKLSDHRTVFIVQYGSDVLVQCVID